MNVFGFLAAPLRRPLRFLIPVVVAGLLAAALGRLWPPRYQASAVLRVERADPGVSIERTILDPERLQRLVEEPAVAAGAPGVSPQERLYRLRDSLDVRERGPGTYSVEYVDEDPQRAADVLERLTSLLTREAAVVAAAPPPSDPLAAELAQAKRELEEKEASHGKTRRSEEELLASSRELLVLQKRYLSLLNRKMSSRLAAVEAPSQSVSFGVEVPARRPERPISPGGRRFAWGVVALGALIGWVSSLRGAPRARMPSTTLLETKTLDVSAQPHAGDVPATRSAPGPIDPAWTEAASPTPADWLEPGSVVLRPPRTTPSEISESPMAVPPIPDELEPGSVFFRAPRPAPAAPPETPLAVPEAKDELEPGSVFLRAPRPSRAARPEAPPPPAPDTREGELSQEFVKPGSVFWKSPPATATQPVPILRPDLESTEAGETDTRIEPTEAEPQAPFEPEAPQEPDRAPTLPFEPIAEALPPTPTAPAAAGLRDEPIATPAPQPAAAPAEPPTGIEPQATVPRVPEPATTAPAEPPVEPPRHPAAAAPLPAPQDAGRADQANVPGLVVSGGPAHGSVLVLASAPVERLVGAAAYCHLRVDFANVAPVHARVAWDGLGLSLSDAGSSTGTYVNGRRIAGRYPLKDGDHISLGPPGSSQSLRLLVYLPPPSERAAGGAARALFEAPGRAAAPTPIEHELRPASTPARRPRRWPAAALALAILATAGFFAGLLLERPAPVLAEVTPARVRTGQTIFLDGAGFDRAPQKNTVRLGDQTAPVLSAREDRLEVAVPREWPFALPAAVSVSVEVGGRRSGSGRLSIVAGPHLTRLEPPVARRGDLVTALGEQLAAGPVTVLVAGLAAEVVRAQPDSLQFRVPAGISTQEGTRLPVDVWVAGEQAERATLLVGHLPVVTELAPQRGPAGERVMLRGFGFDPEPAGNRVHFGDMEALVLSASATELSVSAPASGPLLARQAELALTVQARGATSSRASFTLLGPASGMFVPHFYAAPVLELPAGNHAFVSTELGPVMLLTGPAGTSSPAERAAAVARVLNDLVEEAAKPLALTFEVEPTPSVTLAGGHHVVATATPRDALGYEGLWARTGKTGQATPHTVATHWTALLQDYLTLFVQHQRPTHVLALTPRGQALVDIYTEARKATDGAGGVPTQVFARLWPGVAGRLREMALLVPAPGQSNPGAVVVGRWQGTMEESEKGAQPIQARFFFEGRTLAGSLTRKSPKGMAAETRLRDVSYDDGALSFALPAGGSVLRFKASLREDVMAGVIHADAPDGRALGSFTLSYGE